MLLALVLAQVVNPLGNPKGPIFSQPSLMNRYAFFEAFPASGAGTTTACSTTAPTGARGETLTYGGTGAKTCTKGINGLRSTDILDGDLVSLTTLPRVEYDADGVLGLLVEAAGTNIAIQARPLCNAAWSDVGSPDCTANSTTGPWGTTTMARIRDDEAGDIEGRSQTIATTSATRFTAYCYVKAGSATSATITLAGTGNTTGDCTATATGLSATSSTIVRCTSPAAYTGSVTAVTVSILVGADVADEGTLFVEGCDVKASSLYGTSFVNTGASAVARAAETPDFTLPVQTVSAPWCLGGSVQLPGAVPTNARTHGTLGPSGLGTYVTDSYAASGVFTADSTQVSPNAYSTSLSVTAGAVNRTVTFHDGTNFNGCVAGTCAAGAARAWTNIANVTVLRLGEYNSTNGVVDGIVSRVVYQPGDATRCPR